MMVNAQSHYSVAAPVFQRKVVRFAIVPELFKSPSHRVVRRGLRRACSGRQRRVFPCVKSSRTGTIQQAIRKWSALGDRAYAWPLSPPGTWASQRSPQERLKNTELTDTNEQIAERGKPPGKPHLCGNPEPSLARGSRTAGENQECFNPLQAAAVPTETRLR
jgi:hypothetical protein